MIVAAGGGGRELDVDAAIWSARADARSGALNERLMNDLPPTLFLAQLSICSPATYRSSIRIVTDLYGRGSRRRGRRPDRTAENRLRTERDCLDRRRAQWPAQGNADALRNAAASISKRTSRRSGRVDQTIGVPAVAATGIENIDIVDRWQKRQCRWALVKERSKGGHRSSPNNARRWYHSLPARAAHFVPEMNIVGACFWHIANSCCALKLGRKREHGKHDRPWVQSNRGNRDELFGATLN